MTLKGVQLTADSYYEAAAFFARAAADWVTGMWRMVKRPPPYLCTPHSIASSRFSKTATGTSPPSGMIAKQQVKGPFLSGRSLVG